MAFPVTTHLLHLLLGSQTCHYPPSDDRHEALRVTWFVCPCGQLRWQHPRPCRLFCFEKWEWWMRMAWFLCWSLHNICIIYIICYYFISLYVVYIWYRTSWSDQIYTNFLRKPINFCWVYRSLLLDPGNQVVFRKSHIFVSEGIPLNTVSGLRPTSETTLRNS